MKAAAKTLHLRHVLRAVLLLTLCSSLSGCYIFDFFKKKNKSGNANPGLTGVVLGQSLGPKAGGPDLAALASVYSLTTPHAPAAIRPDPDVFIRRKLLEYRDEGATIARTIGRVEQFRLLLGGASEDFQKTPQETYDATSLLAVAKVADEVCRALVAPDSSEHDDWESILPYPAGDEDANIRWLAQRFIGKPSADIDSTVYTQLADILQLEEASISQQTWARGNPYAKYVPVCSTLAIDAEAMYL